MTAPCLVCLDSPARRHAIPHYFVSHLDYPALEAEFAALRAPFLAIARVHGADVENARLLATRGFRKVCDQILFAAGLAARPRQAAAAPLPPGELAAAALDRHARNLRLTNLSFDPCMPQEVWLDMTRRYIEQTLARPGAARFFLDSGLACLRAEGDSAIIDLFSVLDHRQGIGTALMGRCLDWAAAEGLRWAEVTTECENLPACLFYQKAGFRLAATIGVFHYYQAAE